MTTKPTGRKVQRSARLLWVPLAEMEYNPLAQRELKQWRVDALAADFDLEQFGAPTVNLRNAHYFVIDGYHRIQALKIFFGDGNWEDQQVQCWTYEGLTEQEEAEKFLKLNDTLTVAGFDKFRVAIQAGRPDEVEVNKIVQQCLLRVSRDKGDGAIGAVATLMKVYRRAGGQTLARTLLIVRDAYGDAGLEAPVIDGLGLLCHRFNGELDDARLVQRLSGAHGGVNGLLGKAEQARRATGNPQAHCVAAAAVEIHNGGRGGKKLPSWWREDD